MKVEILLSFEVGNALSIIYRTTTDDAVDIVALLKQELTQIAAVLTR